MHNQNSFLTLTYSEEKLPKANTLRYRDFQLFMHKLRKHVVREYLESKEKPTKGTPPLPQRAEENREYKYSLNSKTGKPEIRFYMCGEYGEKTQRAHYHAILFGYDFKDKRHLAKTKAGHTLWSSETANKIWGNGNVTIGEVNFETAAYTARYIMKKITGQAARKHYETIDLTTGEITNRKPEFTKMSLKPGIAARWLEKYQTDAYPLGKIVVRGKQTKTPKYYDKKYKKINPVGYDDLLFERHKEEQKRPGDNTKERMATREIVAMAKIAHLKRTL